MSETPSMNRCPYCGLEDDTDFVAERVDPFTEGDVLVCDGCGGVTIATGVLWETLPPAPGDPHLARLRWAIVLAQRPRMVEYFARRLGAPVETQRFGRYSP